MPEALLDLQHLSSMSDGDKEFEKELFLLFEADSQGRVDCISSALLNDNWNDLKRELHTLKGASSNVGAIKVHAVTLEMESACETKNKDKLVRLLDQLKSDIVSTIKAFNR